MRRKEGDFILVYERKEGFLTIGFQDTPSVKTPFFIQNKQKTAFLFKLLTSLRL